MMQNEMLTISVCYAVVPVVQAVVAVNLFHDE